MLLIERLAVNPVMFYECMLLSPVDKVFEFNDRAVFYNMVISRDVVDDDPIVVRVIRKNNFAVLVVKEYKDEVFKIPNEIAHRFHFNLVKKQPLLAALKLAKPEEKLEDYKVSNHSLGSDDEPEPEIAEGEIGKIIIQKMRTIKPDKDDKVTIDYIMFWLSSEGLKRIEQLINNKLLAEVNAIQVQSSNPGNMDKLEFLAKMDVFQNHFIGAQNAKESKSDYFVKIIESQLASLEFRYLIRHLKSRMSNLHNTTVIIERKLELARTTFQTAIDANLTEYSKQLDQLMRKFSVVAVMFLPLQLISGMWGMNCMVPFQDVENTWPFYGLTIAMVMIVVVFWVIFKRLKWL
jgi:hypothetical protein